MAPKRPSRRRLGDRWATTVTWCDTAKVAQRRKGSTYQALLSETLQLPLSSNIAVAFDWNRLCAGWERLNARFKYFAPSPGNQQSRAHGLMAEHMPSKHEIQVRFLVSPVFFFFCSSRHPRLSPHIERVQVYMRWLVIDDGCRVPVG